jgi:hypothetical protein
MEVLRKLSERYPKAWGRYGITMLMAENARSEFVWKTFMKTRKLSREWSEQGLRACSRTKKRRAPCRARQAKDWS